MPESSSQSPPLSPRYWLSWPVVGLIWLMGRVPQWLATPLASGLGWLMWRLMKSRRRVALRNIERCFPELDAAQHQDIAQQHFRALGRMLFETAWTWAASDKRMLRLGHYEGTEHLEQALARGKGVLLVSAHFTCLEFGGRLASMAADEASAMYRPLRNPVIEWYQNRMRRKRYLKDVIPKRELRKGIRVLRGGGILWTAPDQDFGARQSTFAPFFGIETATLSATVKLAKMTECAVLPIFPRYDADSGKYISTFLPLLDGFPSGDERADLARINALIEQQVREVPEQYWWIHRRFKTRPVGEPPFYD